MEVLLMCVLVFKLFLEVFVLIAEHTLHEQEMREYFRIVTWHLLEQTNMPMRHVIISDLYHGCREDWFVFVFRHDLGWTRAFTWYGRECTTDTFTYFVMVDITTDYNLHVITLVMCVSELAHHLTSDLMLNVFLLTQNRQTK